MPTFCKDTDFGFDFWDFEREVDGGSRTRDGLPSGGDTPHDTKPVSEVEIELFHAQIIDAELPALLILPRLKKGAREVRPAWRQWRTRNDAYVDEVEYLLFGCIDTEVTDRQPLDILQLVVLALWWLEDSCLLSKTSDSAHK